MVGGLVQIITLLNSKEMVVELFNAYAPSLNIAEMKLGRSTKQRAEILFARLDEFAEQNPAEHTALFKILNTIAAVNSDNFNHKTIMTILTTMRHCARYTPHFTTRRCSAIDPRLQ